MEYGRNYTRKKVLSGASQGRRDTGELTAGGEAILLELLNLIGSTEYSNASRARLCAGTTGPPQ